MEEVIKPLPKELPSHYAERLGLYYSSTMKVERKKELGQFFTPYEIAKFMASFSRLNAKSNLKILDPGCGVGILSTAVIEHFVFKNLNLKSLNLVAFETDINIINLTENCFDYLRSWLNERNIELKFFICKNDFILHNSNVLNNVESDEIYDIVISNPPYFKLSKGDDRVIAAKSVIYGQSNIYTIFLLIAAKLLSSDGQLIFIIPRSFCSGGYFRLFREIFFSTVEISWIHLFSSRNNAFRKDNVLQENVIMVARKKSYAEINQLKLFANDSEICLSFSNGIEDLSISKTVKYRFKDLVNLYSHQKILHIPVSRLDEEVIKIFKTWTGSLKNYKLKVSTGPIVDFRCINEITLKPNEKSLPLFCLHNVSQMKLNWPKEKISKGKIKGQYILETSRVVKNMNYVLLRRFSTKEENKRLVACPYIAKNYMFDKIGIENHLNYIYGVGHELSEFEVYGLSALLSSRLFDIYFRTFNGNINVSATELNEFPLPDYQLIKFLGEKVLQTINENRELKLDSLISKIFKLKIDLSNYG